MKDRQTPGLRLRSPTEVMRLRRMGAGFPTRLSFLRTVLRRLSQANTRVERPVWEMNRDGYGHAVYTLRLADHDYALVAVTSALPEAERTDRVIASAWDAAFVLYDGIPDAADLRRIISAAPQQEAARFTARDLILSRANKSVRLFDHVVAALRAGQQPDSALIAQTGYLMRTTAVYGNGKFGIADRGHLVDRPGLDGPFMAEMLTVWLIRGFTHDLVEHLGGAKLNRTAKRHLGIGNATGLGMAPFLVNHPILLHEWVNARETALARVRDIEKLDEAQILRIYDLVSRTAQHLAEWEVADAKAAKRLTQLRQDWTAFADILTPEALMADKPIDRIMSASASLSVDTQELIIALLLEPFGDLIDDLADDMATTQTPRLDPTMDCADLRALVARDWDWATSIDYTQPTECAQFWYVSENKAEPRLGDRHTEMGADLETPLDIGRQAQRAAQDLQAFEGNTAEFLQAFPQHRSVIRRVQTLARCPYAEIRDNLIGQNCAPIDLLRCKLAFFGAAKFDPKSDRWTRITLAQGAPLFDELDQPDDWWLPVVVS